MSASIRHGSFHQEYAPAERLGESGVALLSRRRPGGVETRLAPRFDVASAHCPAGADVRAAIMK